jgi:hypothetical protein
MQDTLYKFNRYIPHHYSLDLLPQTPLAFDGIPLWICSLTSVLYPGTVFFRFPSFLVFYLRTALNETFTNVKQICRAYLLMYVYTTGHTEALFVLKDHNKETKCKKIQHQSKYRTKLLYRRGTGKTVFYRITLPYHVIIHTQCRPNTNTSSSHLKFYQESPCNIFSYFF